MADLSKCTPINGYMTAWVADDQSGKRHLTDNNILSIIENYILNSKDYASDKVIAVSYVGDRHGIENGDFVTEGAVAENAYRKSGVQDEASHGITPGIIVLIVAVSILVAFGGMAFVKKQMQKNLTKEEASASADSAIISEGELKVLDAINDDDESIPSEEIGEEDKRAVTNTTKSNESFDAEQYSVDELEPCSTFDSDGSKTRRFMLDSVALSRTRSDGASVNSETQSQAGIEIQI